MLSKVTVEGTEHAAPTLSVIIPAFNVQDFIAATIESVLSQSFRDMEVIVVDDGSTDTTLQVITGFQDPRIRVIHKENCGLSAARNTGIRVAQGRYIALLDGDDVWFPGYAERHVAAMESDSYIGITHSYLAYIDEAGKKTGQLLITRKSRVTLTEMIIRNHLNSQVVVRRECFAEAGLFNEELRACEDHEMWVRILHRTRFQTILIPAVLCGYRVRTDSLTMQFDHQIANALKVVDIFKQEIGISLRLQRRSLAEVYRICSRKALSNGQKRDAAHLMVEALQQSPWLVFTDIRAFGTFCLVMLEFVLPERIRRVPYECVHRLMQVVYRQLISKKS
ncbi:MAG: glycosyltransferase [Methylococcales bacterium]